MTPSKPDNKAQSEAPTGVNDDPAPAADDAPQHEDETLGDLLGNRNPESSGKNKK